MRAGERETPPAAVLRDCREALVARGSTIIAEATGAAGAILDWRHYPDGEVYDSLTHVHYFFHRHAAANPPAPAPEEEHGHFHVFLRGEGIPAGLTPLVLPELAVANAAPQRHSAPLKRGMRDEVCHLVAIAVDRRGEPIRLFTTNRWVTGETWYRAEDAIRMLDCVRLTDAGPSGLLNRWIEGLIRLYQPEIAALLRQRDQVVLARRWRSRLPVLEDPRLEIASSLAIDLDARLSTAEAPSPAVPAIARPQNLPLPRMAEGWGI